MKIRFMTSVIGASALLASVLGSAASATADTGPETVELHIESATFEAVSDSVSFHNEMRLLINGATQLTWEMPDHKIKVTKKQVRKAPHLRIKDCAKGTSKYIWRKTDHAPVVVILPGSCLKNEGKLGHIVGGFDWHVKKPAVLKYDKSIKKYRHVFNFINMKLVKTCGNIIGGKVDVHLPKVKQVRYEADVKKSATAVVDSKVKADVKFSFTCPNGAAFQINASAYGSGSASAAINFTERTRVAVATASKLSLVSESHGKAKVHATSAAGLSIDVSAKCGTTVIVKLPPSVSATASACVEQGQTTGVITVVVNNPNDASDTVTVTVGSQTKSASVTAGSSATLTFSGYAPGNYSVVATLVNAQKSATTQVTVIKCDTQVIYEKPLAEIWAGEHAVDEGGTTTVWGRIKCDARLTCLLARPTDNSELGEMVSWMQGNVEDGWLRFSGTWRNANTLPAGEHTVTLTAVGTDSQGQQVTATTTLKVIKVVHPDT